MKLTLLILYILVTSNIVVGQNLNMIIDVNNNLITSEISGVHLTFENENKTIEKIPIGYHPGELLLDQNSWKKIKSVETKKTILSFTYHTWKRNNQKNVTFEIEMKKYHFDKRYLILHIYDFRERKYRRKYGCLTDENYVFEFNFPQGGILVGCK